jgi:coenzyme Q-binding protein COQ10
MFKGFVNTVTKKHIERKVVSIPPSHFFRIVIDVDQYCKFLPFCSHSQIMRKWDSGRRFEAKVSIAFPPLLHETYVSSVTLVPEDLRVEIASIESTIFDSLRSRWQLRPVEGDENKCDVELEVEISTSDPLLSLSLGTIVPQIAVQQVTAFQKRCRQVPIATDADLVSPKQ